MRSWTGELACARVYCTNTALHRRRPFGEVLGWRALADEMRRRQQQPTAQSSSIVLARPRNLRPRAISLFGLSPSLPARHMARCLSMDLSPSRAALPCTFAALTCPHGPHTINPIHSSPRPGRGCVEDLLKRRYLGGRGLRQLNLLVA